MKRIASVVGIRKEMMDRYLSLHEAVWPEVLDQLRQSNISNYSIYQFGDVLFSYQEYGGDHYSDDMRRLHEHEDTRAWADLTDPCQVSLSESTANSVSLWTPIREVFHMA